MPARFDTLLAHSVVSLLLLFHPHSEIRHPKSDMLLAFLIFLLVLNALFAMTEMALVSVKKGRLQAAADKGDKRAAKVLALIANPTRFLSTVQVGITLIAILSGAIGEDALADDMAVQLREFPALVPYAKPIALIGTIALLTFVSLVFTELVPKRLAQSHPEPIAKLMAGPMNLLSRIASPVIVLLALSTDLVLKLIPVRAANDDQGAEEEVKAILASATEEGVFHEAEQQIVERVFKLGDIRVKSLMVPRTDIDYLLAEDTVQRIRVAVATSSHSHFPVCKTSLDDLIGFIHVKDLVKHGLISDSVDLTSLAQPPVFIPESAFAIKALEKFRDSRVHIAFVIDEYGVVVGLITMNDVLDALLGEVTASDGSGSAAGRSGLGGGRLGERHTAGTPYEDPLIVRRADGSYLLDGMLPVGDLRALMSVETLPRQDVADFDTLGGFIMSYLRRIPHTGDTFAFDRYNFEVIDMDRTRVDKVLLTIQPPPADDAAESAS